MRAGIRSRGARAEMIFPGRFDGKVLVVTGAAQGLGEVVATTAAPEGGHGRPGGPLRDRARGQREALR
jgi:NAD(P)-dependent dehydrogenase (short-subunit alcohol dehydrogenase family)